MCDEIRRLSLSDALGGLLDVAGGNDLSRVERSYPAQFGVGRHFEAVGKHMRSAMKGLEREQEEQETEDRK